MAAVAVLHPGSMGAAVGALLVRAGHETRWLPQGRGAGSRRRASAAGLVEADSVAGCDVVLSVCPPAFAVDVARGVAGLRGIYVDGNAVSPATAATVRDIVEAAGAEYVDGGIIGRPPTRPGTTRLYLAGSRATEVAGLFSGTALDARVIEGDCAASALKMAYAAWTKTTAALLVGIVDTARESGVERALLDEWALSQPGLAQEHTDALDAARHKGWRWVEEMRQVAATFDAAGQPSGFGAAAAAVFERFPRTDD